MKKIFIALMILGATGCNNQPNNPASSPSSGIANPASVNCIQKGGTLEMRTNTAGVYGICIFNDGSECDEWEYFRGTCQVGQKKP